MSAAAPLAFTASRYPASAYLLPAAKRLRYRGLDGQLDAAAVKAAQRLLPVAPGIADPLRARLAKVLGRLAKAVWDYGALAGAGLLDEAFGFPIVIEVPEGQQRSGTSADGTPWASTMTGASYGFLPETLAEDAEEVDVYRGPDHTAPLVFVVTQTGDAERKLMLGFACAADALRCYFANTPPAFFGDLHAFPVQLLRELLGYEGGELQKALRAGTSGDGAAVIVKSGSAFVASMVRVDADSEATAKGARVRYAPPPVTIEEPAAKGATGVGSFAGGGVLLPGQGAPRSRRKKALDEVADAVRPVQCAYGERLAKAMVGARACKTGATSLDARPDLAVQPPALAAQRDPLSGTYDNPGEVGGWIGWIEDEPESWIAFVDTAGTTLLWPQRVMAGEHQGAVIGNPVVFERPDLAAEYAAQATAKDRRVAKTGPSFGEIQNALSAALRAKYPDPSPENPCPGPWIRDTFDDAVVYEFDGKSYRVGYTYDAGQAVLVGEPVPVEIAYVPLAAPALGGEGAQKTKKAVRLLPVAKDLQNAPAGKRIVYGVVLEPEPFGGAGDAHDETYSAAEIEGAAHAYLASFGNLNDQHGRFITSDRAAVVESYIAPQDLTVAGSVIKAGAWVLAAKVFDPELWARILAGELGAWSIEGYAERTPNVAAPGLR